MKARNALLLIAFLIIGLLPSSVSASTPENHHVPRLYRGTVDYPFPPPIWPPDEPFPDYPPQPFMGAYMDTNGIKLGGAKKTRVTVSFPDTDPSTIQADNWLAGGMFVTGYGHADQLDYGYYTMLTLEHDGTLYLDFGINETYECLGTLFPPTGYPEGTLPWTRGLFNNTVIIEGVSPSTPITLTASWDEPEEGYVKWEYTVDGVTHPAGQTPEPVTNLVPTIIPSFAVGSRDLSLTPTSIPPSWIVHWIPYEQSYRFQFGIISRYNIGQGGWNVLLSNPSYCKDGEWHNVETAKSIGGQNAILDYRYMWGGEDYEGVSAYYYPSLEPRNVKFYYSGARKDQSQSDLFEYSHANRDYEYPVSVLVYTPPADLKIVLKKVQLDTKVTDGKLGCYKITYQKGDSTETDIVTGQSFVNSEYLTYTHSCNVVGDYGEKITVRFYTKIQGPQDSEAVYSKDHYMHYDVFSPYGEWILDHTVFWGIPVAPADRSETYTYSPPPEPDPAYASVDPSDADYRLKVGTPKYPEPIPDSYAKATLFKDFVPKHTVTNPTFYFRFHARGLMDAGFGGTGSYTYLNAFLRLWHNEDVLFLLDQRVQDVSEEEKEIDFRDEISQTYPGELLEGETYTIEYGFSVIEHNAFTDFAGGAGGEYRIKASWIIKADNYKLTVRTYDVGENEKTGVDFWIDSTHYYSPREDLIVACGDHIVEVDYVFYRGDYEYMFQYWEGGDTSNPRTVSILEDTTLRAYYSKTYIGGGGGGGGGCPFIYTWNGTGYVIDNNLLGDSAANGGADVEDYYGLEQPLVRKDGKYSLLIKEFEQEHSYLDQVKLMAVDHESDVHVAVTHSGEILTYKSPTTPISAVDDNGTSRLDEVSLIDGNISDPSTYFYGEYGDYVTLDFGNLDVSNGAKLVFRGNYEKKPAEPGDFCIHVQVLNATTGWVDIDVVRTRVTWSTLIVDLSDYLPDANGDLKVRLYLTAIHRLDYVGLDTTKQDDVNLHHANMVSAIHSEEGSVKTELLASDDTYAELVPDQQIELVFTLPENSKDTRTFITSVEGHYYIID